MSKDLLPEWLNLFLDDVETSLCLPILIVIVLCTAQFIFNHTVDIGSTFYQNITQKSDDEDEVTDGDTGGGGIIEKIRGLLSKFGIGSTFLKSETNEDAGPLGVIGRSSSPEEEWDYCEDDDE